MYLHDLLIANKRTDTDCRCNLMNVNMNEFNLNKKKVGAAVQVFGKSRLSLPTCLQAINFSMSGLPSLII